MERYNTAGTFGEDNKDPKGRYQDIPDVEWNLDPFLKKNSLKSYVVCFSGSPIYNTYNYYDKEVHGKIKQAKNEGLELWLMALSLTYFGRNSVWSLKNESLPCVHVQIQTPLQLEVTLVNLNSELRSEQANVSKKGEWSNINI